MGQVNRNTVMVEVMLINGTCRNYLHMKEFLDLQIINPTDCLAKW